MTARDDLAKTACDALRYNSFEPPYNQALEILDALAERPGLLARWLTETGALKQVGAVAPVRADGTIDGKWWHYRNDQDWPATAEPVFRVVDRTDTA